MAAVVRRLIRRRKLAIASGVSIGRGMIFLSDEILDGYRATPPPFVPENCLSKELGRIVEMELLLDSRTVGRHRLHTDVELLRDLPGFKSSAKLPEDLRLTIAEASEGERRISVRTVSAQSVVVQLDKLLLADTTSALASASASSILAGSLPPPRALSGRPPPFPPTMGATC